MTFNETKITGVWVVEPKVFGDERGYFMETLNNRAFAEAIGKVDFVQENESCSVRGVLRGLHYQMEPFAQSKLVRVVCGAVLDVAVDIRRGSPTYGKYVAELLSGENKRQFFIPKGFAHGFYVLSEKAIFTYKVDNFYSPAHERGIRFDDPEIGIDWTMTDSAPVEDGRNAIFITSPKDRIAPLLRDADNNFTYNK
ncbi:MAG: dTDP-4-dehydrorhamnose 3,5-epimerase [Tannerella sp.]|nr:dTDP-4-dehydrorhamnose 3,5-epimerase [Tannerella sp.]